MGWCEFKIYDIVEKPICHDMLRTKNSKYDIPNWTCRGYVKALINSSLLTKFMQQNA